jgi:cell shape-determining protein MreC
MDKIFPRDIPVGTVKEVKPGSPFKQILVLPAAKLDRLEEVIVLLTQAPIEFSKEAETPSSPAGNPIPTNSGGSNAASAPIAKAGKP